MDTLVSFAQSELLIWALNILKALAILIAAIVIGRLLKSWLLRLGARRAMNMNVIALLEDLLQIGVLVFALIVILPTFGIDWTALLTLVGTIGLAISLAAQDLLRNFIAGVYILIEQPFKIGDKVKVETGGGVIGTVQSIELRITNLRTDKGEQVVVPNNLIFSNVLINLSAFDLRRFAITITVPGGSLSDVSGKIVESLRQFPDVSSSPGPSTTVESLTSAQVKLEAVFWLPPNKLSSVPAVLATLRDALPSAEIEVTT